MFPLVLNLVSCLSRNASLPPKSSRTDHLTVHKLCGTVLGSAVCLTRLCCCFSSVLSHMQRGGWVNFALLGITFYFICLFVVVVVVL